MIPILFPREEIKFDTNGIGRIAECVSFTVTEERNGIYEAEFTYPITGRHYADIEEGMIVYAIHDDTKTPQPFRIYGRSAPISGLVTFYAHHISYDLGHIILTPFTASSCAAALAAVKTHTVGYNPFTFWTDKSVSNTYTLRTPRPCREMLGGTEGSILDVYGTGEYEFDKFAVKLYVNRGRDTGVRIQYGKNLSNIVQETDYSGLYSAVVPYWQNPNNPNDVVTLPEQFITAPELILYSDVWVDENGNQFSDENGNEIGFDYAPLTMTTMDLSPDFERRPTVEQLRAKAQSRLDASEAWLPDNNITVDFVQLWQTPEYANVAPLERLSLCDKVDVYYPALGIVAKKREIIRVVYDVLLERYSTMEIGTAKVSFAETVKASTEGAIAQAYPSKSMLTDAINSATEQISGAHGGYIKYIYDAEGNPTELLIMDAPTQEQAVKIWRWNVNGLGYSSDGGQTYGLAMTQDGQIVADFITTGTLVANLIKTGILTDEQGKFSLNLETGALVMDSAQLTNADVSGTITSQNATITGGTINIQSDNDEADIIQLNYSNGTQTRYIMLTPRYLQAVLTANGVTTKGRLLPGGISSANNGDSESCGYDTEGLQFTDGNGIRNSWIRGGIMQISGTNDRTLCIIGNVNGTNRFRLDSSGLKFYNSSGTLTKTYSAT